MTKSEPKKQRGWLNKSEMAASLGISVQAFDKWGVEPIERIGRESFYTAQSVLENRLARQAQKQQPDPNEIDPLAEQKLLQERLRHTTAQADSQELKNEVMRRRLVPVEFVSFMFAKVSAPIATSFDTLLMNIRRRVPDVPPRVLDIIAREAVKTRNECARLGEKVPDWIDDFLSSIDQGNIG